MENHVFADATPYPEHAPEQPCWKVFVHRKGVSEPVGCLHVHPSNLPPRKKKNKILWKLPGSLDENPPRFGGHEKERLWEMFKQQKKERRKSKKSVVVNEAEDVQKVAAELEATLLNGQKEDSPTAAALSAAPPPGFTPDQEEPANRRTTSTGEEPPIINKNISARQEAHLKNGNTQSQSPNTASDPIQHSGLPPPPPGLSLQQQQEQQTSNTPTQQSQSTALSFVFSDLTADQLAALPPPALSSLVGNQVAQLLIHSLITPGQLPMWLAHYHPSATKVLLFQTAQAVAQTPPERQQQWESLMLASTPAPGAPPAWDCQGWTVQTVVTTTTPPPPPLHKIEYANNRQSNNHPPSLLVVLTGRTMQRQEILTYHETLILHPAAAGEGRDDQSVRYQIHNDVLSLTRAAV